MIGARHCAGIASGGLPAVSSRAFAFDRFFQLIRSKQSIGLMAAGSRVSRPFPIGTERGRATVDELTSEIMQKIEECLAALAMVW
jgi:hypothetical protein